MGPYVPKSEWPLCQSCRSEGILRGGHARSEAMGTCPACDGSGRTRPADWEPAPEMVPCPRCDRTGAIPDPTGRRREVENDGAWPLCPDCAGHAIFDVNPAQLKDAQREKGYVCVACSGRGRVPPKGWQAPVLLVTCPRCGGGGAIPERQADNTEEVRHTTKRRDTQ